MQNKIRLGVIFGGKSEEHEISCLSAVSVIEAVDRAKYEVVMIGITKSGKWLLYEGELSHIETGTWQAAAEKMLVENPQKYAFAIMGKCERSLSDLIDFALPIVHGTYCEDGKLQGLLEMADIPYGGCGVTASAVAMDKIIAKDIFIRAGLPVGPYSVTSKAAVTSDIEAEASRIEEEVGYPVYIKPANMGSSVGISKVVDKDGLKKALLKAAEYDKRILAEKEINCREIEIGVLGNYEIRASVPGEIVATDDFYDYDAKYVDDGKPKMRIPADLEPDLTAKIRQYAVRAFAAIDGEGFARCDFFLDKDTHEIFINEINSIPGFTKFSMFPLLWEETGSPYGETIERIIGLGYERYNAAHNRKTDKQK